MSLADADASERERHRTGDASKRDDTLDSEPSGSRLQYMAQSDRLIKEQDRCKVCSGAGWTWWTKDVPPPDTGKWIVCRECIGTGRIDHTGRKRQKPAAAPDA
jgi:hypothetical protein